MEVRRRARSAPTTRRSAGNRYEPRGSYPIRASAPAAARGKAALRRFACGALLALAGASLAPGCQVAPITGRRAINAFTPADDAQLGAQAFEEVVRESRLVTEGRDKRMVERIMERLVAVCDDPGFEWQVVLIDDSETANAFALPGGKMAVYTGILPITQDETGLAVVMGHEIGHVVARHGTQRMTQSIGFEYAVQLASQALDTQDYTDLGRQALDLVFGLPFSRGHESEADHIGLIYMARAGYDPREALAFWKRMAAGSEGGGPEFLSTHPSHATRIADLEQLMPQALAEWQAYKDGRKSADSSP